MAYVDDLLKEMLEQGVDKNIIDLMNGDIFKGEKSVGIYGTGLAGQMTYHVLRRWGINVRCFYDSNSEKWKGFCCETIIRNPNEIEKNEIILIAANPDYKIHEKIVDLTEKYFYVDSEYLEKYHQTYFENIIRCIKKNEEKINKVYDLLEDDKSRHVFSTILCHRAVHKLSTLEKIYDENQYFGNDIIKKAGRRFCDCGAFVGDTLQRYIKQCDEKEEYQYIAFEADEGNFKLLVDYCKKNGLTNVFAYNIGVWDKKEKLTFSKDGNEERVAGKLLQESSEESIMCDSLDNVVMNRQIDMITMDIEGAELHALNGARKCIELYKPKLAISAYHELSHLWEVPLLIKEINPNYKIYFRHHRWNMDDTVCYAVNK